MIRWLSDELDGPIIPEAVGLGKPCILRELPGQYKYPSRNTCKLREGYRSLSEVSTLVAASQIGLEPALIAQELGHARDGEAPAAIGLDGVVQGQQPQKNHGWHDEATAQEPHHAQACSTQYNT